MPIVKPIPGKPGHFLTADGDVVVVTEARDTARYDTDDHASGAVTAGDQLVFFRDLANKGALDHNIPQAGKLVTGAERLILESVGVGVQQQHSTVVPGSSDIKRVVCSGFLEIKLNRVTLEEGPVERYPAGYGVAGSTSENNASIASNGIASRAGVRPLREQQIITDEHTIQATVTFMARTWLNTSTMPTLSGDIVARLYMHGILEQAATNN